MKDNLLNLNFALNELLFRMSSCIVDLQICRVSILLVADLANILASLLYMFQIFPLMVIVQKLNVSVEVEGT